MALNPDARRLIELHADRAYAIALRMAGNRADAGDLVQEAFLRVMRYIHNYDPDQPFEGWLYQIIRNIFINSVNLKARRKSVSLFARRDDDSLSFEEVLMDPSPGPERLADASEKGDEIQKALNDLSPAARMAVILVDIEGMGREESARALGCSLSALDVRLHRGRAQLQERLKPVQ